MRGKHYLKQGPYIDTKDWGRKSQAYGADESISQLLKIQVLPRTVSSYTKKFSGPTVSTSDSQLLNILIKIHVLESNLNKDYLIKVGHHTANIFT